jgi:hypothetical protein
MVQGNGNGNSGVSETPPPAAPSDPIRLLTEEIAALKAQVNANAEANQKPPNLAKALNRPSTFKGTRSDKETRAIDPWLESVERYVSANRLTDNKDKIETAASFLEGTAEREYSNRIREQGKFATFIEFKHWLIALYSPSDPVNTFRDRFFECAQRPGEGFEEYAFRFRTAHSLLDTPYPETFTVYHFVAKLLPTYRAIIRGDKEFSDYQNITIDDVVGKLKRMSREGPNSLTSTSSGLSLQDRISGSGNPNKRQRLNPNNGKSASTNTGIKPLTEKQRRFLMDNIKNGGGQYIFEELQSHPAWRKIAFDRKRCYKCAASNHFASNCSVPPRAPKSSTTSGSSLNAIFDELDTIGDLNDDTQL